MKEINVTVVTAIGPENLKKIAAVSPSVKLIDASTVWDGQHIDNKVIIDSSTQEKMDELLSEAEVVMGAMLPDRVIERSPKLKWIQSMLAGVDHILTDDMVKSPVKLTNARGVHAIPMSELALEMMLMHAKQGAECVLAQQKKEWKRFVPSVLSGKTLGVIGLGSIGKAVARLGQAFGMRVLAVRRSAKEVSRAQYVDAVYPGDRLKEVLSQCDYVVAVLPFTPDTEGMIGEKELQAMKSTAFLVNNGRGATIDEKALIKALEKGWIAGAGIDAFIEEPLSPENKLWSLPNVIMSPHVGGRLDNYMDLVTDLFCKNLERYVQGKRLFNVVNKKKGY